MDFYNDILWRNRINSKFTLRLIPSSDQIANNYRPDATNYPNVYGLYNYKPSEDNPTNNAQACRCIKDPLFAKNNYDFPTKFFSETETYKVGLENPNSYVSHTICYRTNNFDTCKQSFLCTK